MYIDLVVLGIQTDRHTAEPLVSDPSAFEVDMAIKELKKHKLLRIDQIPAVLIKASGRTFRYDIHKLVYSAWNVEELPEEQKESIIVLIYKKGNKMDCITGRGTSLPSTKYSILSKLLMLKLTLYAKEIIGIFNEDFDDLSQFSFTFAFRICH
jgi:hypothetical protein